MLWQLFSSFFMIGLVSFGGGYSMIPIIELEAAKYHWMPIQQFTEVIAIAGMSPGPIATNSAIIVGYHVAGFWGAVSAMLGMILPSLLLIVLVSMFFYKIHKNKRVQFVFYGIRPMITGLIIYAAVRFSYYNHIATGFSWHFVTVCAIFAGSLYALFRHKTHPAIVILLSGLVGMAFYS